MIGRDRVGTDLPSGLSTGPMVPAIPNPFPAFTQRRITVTMET